MSLVSIAIVLAVVAPFAIAAGALPLLFTRRRRTPAAEGLREAEAAVGEAMAAIAANRNDPVRRAA